MNKYFFSPILFIRFSGFAFKKIRIAFSLFFLILFSGSASSQWIQYNAVFGDPVSGIYFLNDNTGYISQGFGGTPNLLKTSNGGLNWIDRSAPGFPMDIHFFDENTGISVGYASYKTTNGGLNWSSIIINGEEVSFVNNSTGWILNPSGFIYKTTNAGDNWSSTNLGNSTLSSLYFLNELTGWVLSAGTNSVLKTTDGGSNWNTYSLGLSELLYFNIRFTDANNGTITGDNLFLKTTNGGVNWSAGNSPVDHLLIDQYFINSNTGWIAARFSGVYFTSNGGINWEQQSTGIQTFAFHFTPELTGFIGGIASGNGVIAKTTTGGFNLTAPSNLTATGASPTQINLSWTDNSLVEDKFIIERSNNSVTWTVIDSVNANVTNYSNTGLTINTGYFYRVRAKKLYFSGNPTSGVLGVTLINPPDLLTPSNNYIQITDTPNLAWSASFAAITYHLQVASDTGFTNIVYNTSGGGLLNQTIPAGVLQNSTRYYWRVRCFNAFTQSLFSPYRLITVQFPDYGNNISTGNNLYYFANSTTGANPSPSKPEYSWVDTTGSINLILNGTPTIPVSFGSLDDGRFDLIGILPVGNSIRFFGTDYQNIYVGTNGIIGFNAFMPMGVGHYNPPSSLPQSNITQAIFPFWKDLNFGDADVPINRLCYKVTADQIIITYMRVPNYNSGADPNDFVSFQVIINHSPTNAVNSKIKIQYNFDESGSSFKSKYSNNTLATHIIGMQGTFSSNSYFQYRYVDFEPSVIQPGPMFGSNLALEIGPDVNSLPVELSSFTSTVNRNNVLLNWTTSSEDNNARFEIERIEIKNQNSVWIKAGTINGNGTTTQSKNYSFEDRNIPTGKYKYRLKQVDYNGNFEYHELNNEVIVGIPSKFSLSQNYPNPFNPATKINFEIPSISNVSIQIFDVTGKLITELLNKEIQPGYHTVEFNAVNISSGIYFYRLKTDNFIVTKKMVLMK